MIFKEFGSTGVRVSAIGQGTWEMAERASDQKAEVEALRRGIDLGMTHIDTAEMYASGKAEELVGRAIAGIRDKVFLTTKVLPSNASYKGTLAACERSLKRLQTDCLDLYLLHWWTGSYPLADTMRALEELVKAGKTRFIGVSNLTADEVRECQRALTRERIACDQVCYHLKARGLEVDLLPFCERRKIAVVGYSPFAGGKFFKKGSRESQVLAQIGRRHGKTVRQVALNFLSWKPGLFAIPKSGNRVHTEENAGAAGWNLSREDLSELDRMFPPPKQAVPLAMM